MAVIDDFEEIAALLGCLVMPQGSWFLTEIRDVLDHISAAEPGLRTDPTFRSLYNWRERKN